MTTIEQVARSLIKRLGQRPMRETIRETRAELKFEKLTRQQVERAMKGLTQRYLKPTPKAAHTHEGQWVHERPGHKDRFRFTLFVYADGTQVFHLTNAWSDAFVALQFKKTVVEKDAKKWTNEKILFALDHEQKLAVQSVQGWTRVADIGPKDLKSVKELVGQDKTPFDKALNRYLQSQH